MGLAAWDGQQLQCNKKGRIYPKRDRIPANTEQAAKAGQFLAASAAVFELVWWPCRCFSQAWAPKPNSSTVAIRVAVKRRCMADVISMFILGGRGWVTPPGIGGLGLDFVTIGWRCCRLLAPHSRQMQQLPLL